MRKRFILLNANKTYDYLHLVIILRSQFVEYPPLFVCNEPITIDIKVTFLPFVRWKR